MIARQDRQLVPASSALRARVRTKNNVQICTNVTSLGCIIVVRLVVGRIASEHIRGTIDRRALGIARLNANPILCIRWVVDLGKVIVDLI